MNTEELEIRLKIKIREVKRLKSEIEHLKKMFCVNCGACGTTTEYASCDCGDE